MHVCSYSVIWSITMGFAGDRDSVPWPGVRNFHGSSHHMNQDQSIHFVDREFMKTPWNILVQTMPRQATILVVRAKVVPCIGHQLDVFLLVLSLRDWWNCRENNVKYCSSWAVLATTLQVKKSNSYFTAARNIRTDVSIYYPHRRLRFPILVLLALLPHLLLCPQRHFQWRLQLHFWTFQSQRHDLRLLP